MASFQFQSGGAAAAHPVDGCAVATEGSQGMTHLTEGISLSAGFRGAELNILVAVKANRNIASQLMSGSILNSVFHGSKIARKRLKLFHSYL